MELSDLEICIKIAEIEGFEFDAKSLFAGGPLAVWPKCEFKNTGMSIGSGSYNPLTDDGLCFKLMVKHKVDLIFNFCGSTSAYYNNKNAITQDSTNHAICLAIIEAHKDNV